MLLNIKKLTELRTVKRCILEREECMAKPILIHLTDTQRAELVDLRDHAKKPYLRERAAALLKISTGCSGRETAHHGLLRHRRQDTVYVWVHRYLSEGMEGLCIRPGRGRKPAFFPSDGK
jgi:hypothetical protein